MYYHYQQVRLAMAMVVVGRDLRSAMRCDGLCSLAAASELQALSCRSRSPPPTSNHCSSSQQQTLGGWVVAECSWACLVHPEIQKVFKILCHIESYGICMKH